MNPVDDFLKHAGFMDLLRGIGRGLKGSMSPLMQGAEQLPGEGIGRMVGQVGVPALSAAGLAAIGSGVSKGIGAITERFSKARDFKAMLQANPTLGQADAGTTQMYFNSLRHVAPSLSKDPLVAGSFIRNMLELQPESGPAIPPQTAKMLADAQQSISKARDSHPIADAFMSGKPSFYQPEQPMLPPKTEMPFSMGPGGLTGRFPSSQEALEFAGQHNMPVLGPERPMPEPHPLLTREERLGPIPGPIDPETGKPGPSKWGLVGETKKHYER